jgi:putative intracellular protease/amidase
MVLTSHDQLGATGAKTGVWLEEFADPFFIFKDAGAQITLTSPKGGQAPLDPKSMTTDTQTDSTLRFQQDMDAQDALAHTIKLSEIVADQYDAVFYPGGHGPLWDLAENWDSIALIESMYACGKPVAAVCHGPAAFRHANTIHSLPLVRGKAVTGFTNSEETASGLTQVVPFSVEDMLKKNGAKFTKAANWQSHVLTDGNLITGQNPASSDGAATALLRQLNSRPASPSVSQMQPPKYAGNRG